MCAILLTRSCENPILDLCEYDMFSGIIIQLIFILLLMGDIDELLMNFISLLSLYLRTAAVIVVIEM